MFSTVNFIVPLNSGDTTLKLRNSTGKLTNIIREATCTIKRDKKFVYVKQSGESDLITLDFVSDSEAISAANLLRDAIDALASNLGIAIDGNGGSGWKNNSGSGGTLSMDVKHLAAANTAQDGDDTGMSGLTDDPTGHVNVNVFVNGVKTFVGNGCTAAQFLSPQFECIFAKEYAISSYTSNTVTITGSHNLQVGNSLIINVAGTNRCYDINNVTGNVITLTGASLSGTINSVLQTKAWGNIRLGDILLWFGSYAGYELDTSYKISYEYFK